MKILVTGANSYLGKGIVSALCDRGHEVIAVDCDTAGIDSRATAVKGGFRHVHIVYQDSRGEPIFWEHGVPDVVVHLAWCGDPDDNSAAHLDDLGEHYRFVEEMLDFGVEKIACMGSMSEPDLHRGIAKDGVPYNPVTNRGIAKSALRQSLSACCLSRGGQLLWLRPFNTAEASRMGSSYCSSLVRRISSEAKKRADRFPLAPDGKWLNELDYEDFCNMVADAITQAQYEGVINICSGIPEAKCRG